MPLREYLSPKSTLSIGSLNTGSTENTVNTENTPNEGVDFENSIKILWNEWNYNSESLPTNSQKNIIIGALKYNSDVDGFWLPLLQERRTIKESGGFTHKSMKYWFESGFSEMEMSEKKPPFRISPTGCFIAYCSKCGNKQMPNNEWQIREGSSCCHVEYVPERIKHAI